AALKTIKEQLRQIPGRGFAYGLLRCGNCDIATTKLLEKIPEAQISFNYLGQFDQVLAESKMFAPAVESPGNMAALENPRQHLIDVVASVVGGRLGIAWKYSEKLHLPETIERIAQEYVACLRELIEHCRSRETSGYISSDFPLANLTQDELGRCIGAERVDDLYPL